MYYSYCYYPMEPQADCFRSTYVSITSQSFYDDWPNVLTGCRADDWLKLIELYTEDYQQALLVAFSIVGFYPFDAQSVFRDLYHENAPFQGFARLYLRGALAPEWQFFARKLALETYKSIHYPAVCPAWLFPYGYTQAEYQKDLAIYWDSIHDDYYQPWETNPISGDAPEIARLRKIS